MFRLFAAVLTVSCMSLLLAACGRSEASEPGGFFPAPEQESSSIALAHVQQKLGAAAEDGVGTYQPVASGRVDVKPEIAYRFDMSGAAFVEPKIMVGTLWSLGDAAGSPTGGPQEARLMAETGITFGSADGLKLQVGGSVEEGEAGSSGVWSGRNSTSAD